MRFVYQDVSLEYRPDRGFLQPASGEWVQEPLACLKGWIEPDPARRRRWVDLVAFIEDYLQRRGKLDLSGAEGEEVAFDQSAGLPG